jgi:curli biogenesis system outer membrane secretion channel CsgG
MNYSLKASKNLLIIGFVVLISAITGCATESHRSVDIQSVNTLNTSYNGVKTTLVIGNFQNRSNYMQGLFSSDIDRLGNQSKTILKAHLQQTNRFKVVDRENLDSMKQEAELRGIKQDIKGARYTVTGDVTEFGRKVTGDRQFFGILGKGKQQIAYAKVTINIVDVLTSEIVYSVQGAGEYELSNREIIGFGGRAEYDSTLNGKVLNFAIIEAVNNITKGMENGEWKVEK